MDSGEDSDFAVRGFGGLGGCQLIQRMFQLVFQNSTT